MRGITYTFVETLLARYDGDGKAILEIGCGAMQYRKKLRGFYRGLDLAESAYVGAPVDFECSATDIPLESQEIDLAFGVGVFVEIVSVDRAFEECYRVL